MSDEFKKIIIEGLDDSDGDFQKAVIRDIIIDLPVELLDGYGTHYGTRYGYRL